MNKYLPALGVALILTGSGGHFSDSDSQKPMSTDGISSFHNCFDSEYHAQTITPEEAYKKGECFMNLAKGNRLLGQSIFNQSEAGADRHTILQYANSWFVVAAGKGSSIAKYSLEQNRVALYDLEYQATSDAKANREMLAYKRQFNMLDVDHNGYLSLDEVQVDQKLARSFSQSDINDNGRISLGEYMVSTSEATAAGYEE